MASEIFELFDEYSFASLYDHFNAWVACDDFYLNKACEIGGSVLDLGCGTGVLACRIAAEGLSVVGVDPAEGMLRVARSRPGARNVAWIKGNAQDLRLEQRFDLICMDGHAYQVLLTDEDALAALRTAAHHLNPKGQFVFETRNPLVRTWLSWTADNVQNLADIPALGRIEESADAIAHPSTDIIELVHRYRFTDAGNERFARSGVRFIGQKRLAELISEAGLAASA